MNSKIIKKLNKKIKDREKELELISGMDFNNPLPVKKPKEFAFDRDKVEDYSMPIGINNKFLEKKSDGFGVHLLIDQKKDLLDKVRIYSSDLKEWDFKCFPELWKQTLDLKSGYYRAELAGMRNKDNFTSLDEFTYAESRPKLRYEKVTEGIKRDFPLQLNIFDVLSLEGNVVANKPLYERRKLLENLVSSDPEDYVSLIEQWKVNDESEMQKVFLEVVSKGYEGLVAKDSESLHLPGSRNEDWLKMKDWLTLDLAILGFYDTDVSINNGQLFSAMLVGSYNPESEKFETVSKISSPGLEEQKRIYSLVNYVNTDGDFNKVLEANDEIYFNPKMQKIGKKVPNRIVVNDPRIMPIVEVQCLNVTYSDNFHSCGNLYGEGLGHSLRIGSYKRLRDDKLGIKDVNTTQELHELYLGLK